MSCLDSHINAGETYIAAAPFEPLHTLETPLDLLVMVTHVILGTRLALAKGTAHKLIREVCFVVWFIARALSEARGRARRVRVGDSDGERLGAGR